MPAIKCPACGHRILPASVVNICTNCGALLPSASGSTAANSTEAASPASSAEQALVPYGPPHLPMDSSPSQPSMRTMELQPYQSLLPDQPATRNTALDPFSAGAPTIFVEKPQYLPPNISQNPDGSFTQSPISGPLPHGLPRRPPDLTGTLVSVQSQLEFPQAGDWMDGFFKQLRDIIWPISMDQQHQERKIYVTTLRIRTSDGMQQDARMEGYLKGVNVSLGDTLSLWGRRRRGALQVYRGYNHTSRGMVTTNAMSSALPVLLFLLMFVVALFFLSTVLHLSVLQNILSFLH